MKAALATLVLVLVLVPSALARQSLSSRQIAFWDRVADCEEHGAWWQRGGTFVSGLGIWAGNWYAWRSHVGVYTEAYATSRIDQMRVAQWGYEHANAWWGCFAVTGRPIVE